MLNSFSYSHGNSRNKFAEGEDNDVKSECKAYLVCSF